MIHGGIAKQGNLERTKQCLFDRHTSLSIRAGTGALEQEASQGINKAPEGTGKEECRWQTVPAPLGA